MFVISIKTSLLGVIGGDGGGGGGGGGDGGGGGGGCGTANIRRCGNAVHEFSSVRYNAATTLPQH